ncbi:hypothetical protein BTJ39_22365 [Izhakiella australiensis]|uniref:Uncharacterized protein n=1 Tax=Izhakiella australiensis TaxID=1926881 RepID=A0A1S8Y9X0_9GAMM|nr:hypothetical protein BTJ39_22365 [Izhakiella australiensis]
MEPVKTEAYFFNPGLSPDELEDWLGQQQHAIKCYNSLIREKAELEERLSSVNAAIKDLSRTVDSGRQSYPWYPIPRP